MKDDIEAEAEKEVSNANEEHLREENIEHNKGIMINIKQLIEENKIDIENIKDQIKLKVQFKKQSHRMVWFWDVMSLKFFTISDVTIIFSEFDKGWIWSSTARSPWWYV